MDRTHRETVERLRAAAQDAAEAAAQAARQCYEAREERDEARAIARRWHARWRINNDMPDDGHDSDAATIASWPQDGGTRLAESETEPAPASEVDRG